MSEAGINRTVTLGIERPAERTIKRLAFEVHGELIRNTPVDTGWARANWLVSLGRPINETAGSRDSVSTVAQGAGQARLLVYRLGQDIWISNNVPYIQALNEGHSKQAPEGWVEAAIETAIRKIVG